MQRAKVIEYLRNNGFNCFPLPYNQKAGDSRYQALNTVQNQPIRENENYGYIPLPGRGSCIIDFDNKEKYREFAETNIANGCFVVETPHGWHIPVKGLSGHIDKVELFDYDIQDKKIVEIQGQNHYCVGPISTVDGKDYKLFYGKIWDAQGMDFHDFVDKLCNSQNLKGREKNSGSYAHLREKFAKGEMPGRGQSNDYFFQAALWCNTEGLTKEQATDKIRAVYDKWEKSDTYSNRPWSNIEAKISDVYDNDQKIRHGGHRESKGPSPEDIANSYMNDNNIYSDKYLEKIYRTDNGFLEDITVPLKYIISRQFRTDENTTNKVLFRILSDAGDVPPVDDAKIRFKNGTFDIRSNSFDSEDFDTICMLGYPKYEYKEDPKPYKFCGLIVDQIRDDYRKNLLAFLSKVVTSEREIRMAIFYGIAGCGKSALAATLQLSLGDFAFGVTMSDFFRDRATQSKMIGKTMLYFQDTPKEWSDIDRLKQVTGETFLAVRDMYKETETTRNMLSVVMSSNNLPKIENIDSGPMFDRLSIVMFEDVKIRGTENDDENFPITVSRDEGEDIVSWCLNLRKYKYKFDPSEKTKNDWENISCPEAALIAKYTRHSKDCPGMSPLEVRELLESKTDRPINMDVIRSVLKNMGYQISHGVYKDLDYASLTGTLDEV